MLRVLTSTRMTFRGPIEEDEFRPIRVLEAQLGDHEDEEYEEKPKKLWKQKKIDMADFENSIDHISASARFILLL